MKKQLKSDVYIEYFDSISELGYRKFCLAFNSFFNFDDVIFLGKLSDITEDTALLCIDELKEEFKTAKEELLSIKYEYCIIYKSNE